MGQAKIKQRDGFAPELISEWEAEDCVNFAVALARLSGWILHVDWWANTTEPDENLSVDLLTPLRVYVADNREGIFDVRGVKSIAEFHQATIIKLARKVMRQHGSVVTRYYSEERLSTLPLRFVPDEAKIALAKEAIEGNPAFLKLLPVRPASRIPAHLAARYTFGRCVAFAEAMKELTGLQPTALLGLEFAPQFAGTRRGKDGFFHSVVMHPDGLAEDVWGTATLEDIASRFGAIRFKVSDDGHERALERTRQSSGEIYDQAVQDARELIQRYRLDS